jgi:hypothetical protein
VHEEDIVAAELRAKEDVVFPGQSPGPSGAVDDELISLAEKGDIMAAAPTVGSSPYSSDEEGASHKQHMMGTGRCHYFIQY